MKKFIIAALALFMLLSVPAYAENIYEPTPEAYELVDYVNDMIDEPYASSACQMFVRTTFEDCLNVENTDIICCASKAWEVYGVSDSEDIPIGAAVYFSGSSVVDSYCGQSAGHVGIYLGDGYIAHDWGAKIIKTTVKYVTDRGYTYLGWGWQGNYSLTDAEIEDRLSKEERLAAVKPIEKKETEPQPEAAEIIAEKEEPAVPAVKEEPKPLKTTLEPGIKVSDSGL